MKKKEKATFLFGFVLTICIMTAYICIAAEGTSKAGESYIPVETPGTITAQEAELKIESLELLESPYGDNELYSEIKITNISGKPLYDITVKGVLLDANGNLCDILSFFFSGRVDAGQSAKKDGYFANSFTLAQDNPGKCIQLTDYSYYETVDYEGMTEAYVSDWNKVEITFTAGAPADFGNLMYTGKNLNIYGFEQSLDQSDPDSEYDYYGMWVENTSGEFINNVDIIVNILDKDNTILEKNYTGTTVPLAPGRKCWFKSIYEKGEQVYPEPSGYQYCYGIDMSVSDYEYESGDLTTDIQAAVTEKSDPEGAQTETTESAAVVFAYQDGTRSEVELMNMTGCKAKRMRIMRACVLDGGETINARDFGTPREISEIMAVSQIVIGGNRIHQYVHPDTLYDIELEDQDGKVWTFFNLALGRYAKVELCLEDDYTYYIGYTHEGQTEDFKGYRIRRYETPKVRYVIAENNLKARNIPDDAGEIFAQVLPRTSVELLGEAHGMKNGKETKWYLTRIDDRYGYIVKRKKYYTDSLENDPNAFYRQYQIIQYLEMADMILVQEDAESQVYTGSGSDTTTVEWGSVDYTDSYGSHNYSSDLFKDDPNRDLTYGSVESSISHNMPGVDEYSMIGYDTLIEGYPGHFLHYEVDWEGEPLYVNMYEYFKDNILVFCRYTSRDKNPNPVCVRSGRSMRGIA